MHSGDHQESRLPDAISRRINQPFKTRQSGRLSSMARICCRRQGVLFNLVRRPGKKPSSHPIRVKVMLVMVTAKWLGVLTG